MGNNKFHEAINLPDLMIWLTCCTTLMCHGDYFSFQGDVSPRCQWIPSNGQFFFFFSFFGCNDLNDFNVLKAGTNM